MDTTNILKNIKHVAVILFILVATPVLAQDLPSLVDRLNTSLGIKLPTEYEQKVREFVNNNEILEDKLTNSFTEEFIVQQMKNDWEIDKQNQLLFVWYAIYEELTGKDLYDGEDGNDKRLDEFEKTVYEIDKCGKQYRRDFVTFAQKRSADAQKREQKIMIELTQQRLEHIKKFYSLYKENPRVVRPDEINHMMNSSKEIIADCKEYNIDYKKILSEEVRKFYGIE